MSRDKWRSNRSELESKINLIFSKVGADFVSHKVCLLLLEK